MNKRIRYLVACVTTALAFGACFAAFMAIAASIEGVRPPISTYWRLIPPVTILGFIGQYLLGFVLISSLAPRGKFNLPTLLLIYLAPVLSVGLFLANTTNDLIGIIPWACFALVSASAFFVMAKPLTR